MARSKPDNVDTGGRKIKPSCHDVWQEFGFNAERFMARHDNAPSPEALHEAGLMAAVRDATVEVGEGEIFVIITAPWYNA